MMKFSATSIFCHDIREEKAGTETLVGVLPDNINVPAVPSRLPQLCSYTRIIMLPPFDQVDVSAALLSQDGSEFFRNSIDKEILKKAHEEAAEAGAPMATIVSRIVAAPMEFKEVGRMIVRVEVDGEGINCGQLNIRIGKTISTNASPQHS